MMWVYLIWLPIQVLIGLAWFREMNAFRVDRPDRPRLRHALAVAYLVWAWFPLACVLIGKAW